ncbi:unnamed protein product [Adineta steineri]|uniref:Uncharacterized protein n=1 Tax=Adineta steineri TaxID=433720 RepID=A0A814P7V9_9BILA|nr:unnamed protein product [Adineta steineri]CAF1484965.1 unnamed protein product [Adineta steineri]CAF1493526.1 unnamed protein product [Adineta steineri]CAF3657104.1 unnamed protein product [Adineta steineri]CAF3885629.1 unnamed protein product [Adineta steineri]
MQRNLEQQTRHTKEVTMSWTNVTVEVIEKDDSHLFSRCKTDPSTPCRVLIDRISGVARPGEILAVMGMSGAGE